MKYKQQKLLFMLSQNARQSLKELGRELKQSEQTTAYQIKQLESKQHITYTTLVDHIMLGNTNLLLGLQLKQYSKENQLAAERILKKNQQFISILKCSGNCDYLVEVTSRNLSHFNKNHAEFMQDHNNLFKTSFTYPIIVRHSYPRNYLIRKNVQEDLITLGDREMIQINDDERNVLELFQESPRMTILDAAKKAKLGIKKTTSLKRSLEKKNILRKYSCFFDYGTSEISKELIFVQLNDETKKNFAQLVEFGTQQPNCIELYKLIGSHNILLVVESLNKNAVLEELRALFTIDTFTVNKVEKQY